MNPTDPNNPNSSNPFGGTPLPDHNTLGSTPPPQPTFTPPPPPSEPPSLFTSTPAPNPVPPAPSQPDLGSVFTPAPTFPPPPEQPPINQAPPMPEPPSPSIPPTSIPNPNLPGTTPSLSPLDNPMGMSSQTPVMDNQPPSSGFNWSNPSNPATPPTPVAPATPESIPATPNLQDLYGGSPNSPQSPSDSAPIQAEPAPTDLSHLINTGDSNSSYTPPLSQPETLVTQPGAATTEVPNVPTENSHRGIPKWAIGVGVALLLAVVGASAYFILGIGRNTPEPASVPATETSNQAPAVVASTIPVAPAPVTELQASPSATASTSATPNASGSSALQKLLERQQQSPTP